MFTLFLTVFRLTESKAKLNCLLRSAEILDEQKVRDLWRKPDVKIIFSGYFLDSVGILETSAKISRKDGTFSLCGEWI